MDVQWKPIIGYEGLYEISSSGLVKSLDRFEIAGNKTRIRRERILKPGLARGYLRVVLCKEGKIKNFAIHSLVAKHFLGEKNHGCIINHKNGKKTFNSVDNLEWCSRKENSEHAQRTGLYARGESHYKARLSSEDVTMIKEMSRFFGNVTMAKKYHVSISAIQDIVKGRTWKSHVV